MPGKDLLVPGTSGCKLKLDGADIGWPTELTAAAWLTGASSISAGFQKLGVAPDAEGIVERLSMEFADPDSYRPTKTTLKTGSVVTPGEVLWLVYNQFQDFDAFRYDWRSDIRRSAELLLEELENERATGDSKWRILAHSQGGLVVVAASKLYAARNNDDDRAFASLVSHVAFLATPLSGTVNAADALLRGENLTATFARSFKAIVRTWPAIHQMLPVWPGSVRISQGTEASRANHNLQAPEPWAAENVNPAMLQRARDTRSKFFRDPISRMNGVKVRFILSRAHNTQNHALLQNGVLTLPELGEPGDTLVPAETSYRMAGQVERDRTHGFEGGPGTLTHFALANDPVIATEVKSFFTQ